MAYNRYLQGVLLFSFNPKSFLISLETSVWTNVLFRSVLFNFSVFGDFSKFTIFHF